MPYKDNYLRKMWDKSKKKLNSQIAITFISMILREENNG